MVLRSSRLAKLASSIIPTPSPPKHQVPEPPADGSISVHKIDFMSFGIPEYKDRIAIVIDNAFSEADCLKLLSITGATIEFGKNWDVAKVNAGPGSEGVVYSDYRNGQRVIRDDFEMVDWLLHRLRPHLKEIESLNEKDTVNWFGAGPHGVELAQMLRINERLRFLRYGPGNFFKRHCDGRYHTPDQSEVSFFTLQIYLNGSPSTLKGGATRIFSMKDSYGDDEEPLKGPCVDIPPRTGRCLVFEQRGILHSGETVTKGIKVSVRTEFMYGLPNAQTTPRTKTVDAADAAADAADAKSG